MGKLKTVTWLSVKSYNHSQITIALYVKINLTISKNWNLKNLLFESQGVYRFIKLKWLI